MHSWISHCPAQMFIVCSCLSDVYRSRPRIVFILKKSMFMDVFHNPAAHHTRTSPGGFPPSLPSPTSKLPPSNRTRPHCHSLALPLFSRTHARPPHAHFCNTSSGHAVREVDHLSTPPSPSPPPCLHIQTCQTHRPIRNQQSVSNASSVTVSISFVALALGFRCGTQCHTRTPTTRSLIPLLSLLPPPPTHIFTICFTSCLLTIVLPWSRS